MTRPLTRRIAASAAAAAIVAGGITVGTGVASAAPTECGTQASQVFAGPAGLVKIKLTKQVIGDGTVAPGGTVSYKITVGKESGTATLLRSMTDYFPAGFTLQSATVDGKTVKTNNDYTANTVSTTSGWGWTIDGSPAEFVTTYKVPADAKIGSVLDSGASATPDAWGEKKANPMGVCVTVRAANPGEIVTGSLDSSGFGSSGPVASGSAASSIINNPAGFIGDIIANVFKSAS
ncbi:hypothetical protein [Prescottella subtropica]|uniref:hypothetical protein n=1 Tax=Prescottella subtropica TaxID=2545757 RepID=UPI0010F9D387|nr:hypothetical protein [Prescottella subtropica]